MTKPPGYFEERDATRNGTAGKEVAQRVSSPRLIAVARLLDGSLEFGPIIRVKYFTAMMSMKEVTIMADAMPLNVSLDC